MTGLAPLGQIKDMSLQTVSRQSPIYTRVGRQYLPAKVRTTRRSKKLVLPMFTSAAIGLTLSDPINQLVQHKFSPAGFREFGTHIFRSFVGIDFGARGQIPHFKFRYLLNGLVPFFAVYCINRSGIFRSTNQRLGRMGVPIRFS